MKRSRVFIEDADEPSVIDMSELRLELARVHLKKLKAAARKARALMRVYYAATVVVPVVTVAWGVAVADASARFNAIVSLAALAGGLGLLALISGALIGQIYVVDLDIACRAQEKKIELMTPPKALLGVVDPR
jgi:hypothetical protein